MVRLWSSETAAPVSARFEDNPSAPVAISGFSHLSVDPQGRWVAAATRDSRIYVWDSASGAALFVCPLAETQPRLSPDNGDSFSDPLSVVALFFSKTGEMLHVIVKGGAFVTFHLRFDERPLEEMRTDIVIRSGLESDAIGGIKNLEPQQLEELRQHRSVGR